MKIAALFVLAGCACANAQIWIEVGDAGQNNVAAAQVPIGTGPLTHIVGQLDGVNDVDLYSISITDEALFLASVTAFPDDSMLWLFNMDGTLQVLNDDFSSLLSALTSQGVVANGHYILGISSFVNLANDSNGNDVFSGSSWPGPDVQQLQGNGGVLAGWNNNGFSDGNYEITLRGVEYIPTPGAAALLGLGGLMAARRRRA